MLKRDADGVHIDWRSDANDSARVSNAGRENDLPVEFGMVDCVCHQRARLGSVAVARTVLVAVLAVIVVASTIALNSRVNWFLFNAANQLRGDLHMAGYACDDCGKLFTRCECSSQLHSLVKIHGIRGSDMAKIGDFVTAFCFIPGDVEIPEQIRQGILSTEDPDRRHRVLIGADGGTWVARWNQEVEVVPDGKLPPVTMSRVFEWRRDNKCSR